MRPNLSIFVTCPALATALGIATVSGIGVRCLFRPSIDRPSIVLHSSTAIEPAPKSLIAPQRDLVATMAATPKACYVIVISTTSGLNRISLTHRDLVVMLDVRNWWWPSLIDMPVALPRVDVVALLGSLGV